MKSAALVVLVLLCMWAFDSRAADVCVEWAGDPAVFSVAAVAASTCVAAGGASYDDSLGPDWFALQGAPVPLPGSATLNTADVLEVFGWGFGVVVLMWSFGYVIGVATNVIRQL